MKRLILTSIIFFSFLRGTNASNVPALEREISLSVSNEKIQVVLKTIEEQAEIVFSYNPSILANTKTITVTLKQKTIRETLALILPKNVMYKSKNNYIILKEKPLENSEKKTTEVNGYVYDKNTNQKLPNVTLYDKSTLQSVTTDEYGYYSINVPNKEQCLSVNKEDYQDTCIAVITQTESSLVNISIDPINGSSQTSDSLKRPVDIQDLGEFANDLFKKFKGYINTQNVKDEFSRNTQVSFLPFIGTNKLMSGNVYNKYSFNILGGYSKGTSLAEIGSVFNVDKENVHGIQLAGVFNIVGDSIMGVQMAGLLNASGKNVYGLQASGGINANIGTTEGAQFAGLLNMNWKEAKGAQFAGLGNLNVNGYRGGSFAGLLNANRKSVTGIQIAGLLNITGDTLIGTTITPGINYTTFSNHSKELAGLLNVSFKGENNIQLSALGNSTIKGSSRLQVATFFNKTQLLTGAQIGLINFADSAAGIPFGFLSIVKKGLHQLELSSDEVFYLNASYRTGVNAFYNIFSAGATPHSKMLWNIGYGIGTSFKLANKLRTDITASINHVSSGSFYIATSELYKFYIGLEYRIGKKISIVAGPTYNLYWSDMLMPEYTTTYYNVAPDYSFNHNLANDFNLKGWFGGKVALRFF